MTYKEFFGCALISFGPPLAMFCLTIAKDPIRIIILISAAFFWLMSLLISSLLWYAVVPLREQLAFGVVFSVLFQELFRYFFYRLLRIADAGLKKMSEVNVMPTAPLNHLSLAYVTGLGFGTISGAFALVNVLADAAGPGTVGIAGDNSNFFLISAYTTLAFVLMHTFWAVIFFQSLDYRKYHLTAFVVVSHLFVSCMSLVNQSGLYWLSLLTAYATVVASGVIAFLTAGGSFRRSPPPESL